MIRSEPVEAQSSLHNTSDLISIRTTNPSNLLQVHDIRVNTAQFGASTSNSKTYSPHKLDQKLQQRFQHFEPFKPEEVNTQPVESEILHNFSPSQL